MMRFRNWAVLVVTIAACGSAGAQERPKKVQAVNPETITVLMARDATLEGGLCQFPGWPQAVPNHAYAGPKMERDRKKWKRYADRADWWVEVWESSDDRITWNISVPEAANYNVYMLGTGRNSVVEVASGDSKSTGWVNNAWDVMWDVNHHPPQARHAKWRAEFKPPDDYFRMVWAGWDRLPLGTIQLPVGESVLTVRAKTVGSDLGLYSLELVRPDTEVALTKLAEEMRADTKWLADTKYGLFFHWTSTATDEVWKATWPRTGDRKPWPKNVDDFNVEAFADMVADTGAGHIIFSSTWASYCFPAPIKAIEAIMPGRTSKRDLIMELADALNKRGIYLMLYHNWLSDPEWRKKTEERFVENWCTVMTEIGQRYGKKLAGYWFDTTPYALNVPFEKLSAAAKAGHYPGRVIGYTQGNFLPKLTDFQDYSAGEGCHFWIDQSLLRYVPKGGSGIFTGGRQQGLRAHQSFAIEEQGWIHNMPDKEISKPLWSEKLLIEQVREAVERKFVPTLAIAVYEDGTAGPKTLELLRGLKKAIQGD